MLNILIVCLCLGINVHSGTIAAFMATSTTAAPVESLFSLYTTPTSRFDIEVELEKIAATCLTHQEEEQLSGSILKYVLASSVNVYFVLEAKEIIGLTELRSVLGFAPLGPWTSYREPSRDEIEAAPTVEAYYELKEPRSEKRSLDSRYFFEKNLPPAIAFLDKRIPAIRTIYRRKFSEIRGRPEAKTTIDRKEVDLMIDEFITTSLRIQDAFFEMFHSNIRCLRASRVLHNLHE